MPDEPEPYLCVHCGADCALDADEQEHAADCPFSTGLWPMEADPALELAAWVRWESVEATDELRTRADEVLKGQPICSECESPLRAGDVYMLRNVDTGEVEHRPFVGSVICIGCASGVGR